MMWSDDNAKLAVEMASGSRHKETFDSLVKPFIIARSSQLFNDFIDTDSEDLKSLQLLKIEFHLLKAMESHFINYIETGKLAETQLNRNNKNEH